MNFFKNLFKKNEEIRTLNAVSDLVVKDMIVLNDSFALPEILRGKQFEVTEVATYEYEDETSLEWSLRGTDSTQIFLGLDEDDETFLEIAIKLKPSDVEVLFDLDNFAEIFDNPEYTSISKLADNDKTAQWTADEYRQSSAEEVGYYHRADNRANPSHIRNNKGEMFSLFTLMDKDEEKGVSIEVWDGGETDVSLVIYRPLTDIVDFFPGS